MYAYPKEYLSVADLIQKLENKGMIIDSYEGAETALTTIGYYRLKGYCYHLVNPITQNYEEGTTFSSVVKLHQFDSKLSHLLFYYLSQIEISLKSRLVYSFQVSQESPKDVFVLSDPSKFKDKLTFWKNQGTIASEIYRSKDAFIQHNFQKYDGAIPIWAAVEVMSFGTVSKIIKNMKADGNSAFSELRKNYKFRGRNGRDVFPSQDMLTSWVYAVSILRNICAHNGRIYNRVFKIRPKLLESDAVSPTPQYYGLYEMLLSMKYLRPSNNSWVDFYNELKQLLNVYYDVCDLYRLNFPVNWEDHLSL